MAINQFLHSARAAASVLAANLKPPASGGSDDPHDRILASRELWLTPDALNGFDPNDFPFLTPEQRTQLAEHVDQFRARASALAGREPTPNELWDAVNLWTEVFDPIRDYVASPEGMAIVKALWAAKEPLPDFVLGLDYTLDTDATGDPAIWIWAIIKDETDLDSLAFREFAPQFRARVRKVLQATGNTRLPYVRFRTISEAREVLREEAV